jgi:hypothetical protein
MSTDRPVVPAQDRPADRVEVGVPAFESVRNDHQGTLLAPPEATAEKAFEALDHTHRHRVHHLLVCSRVRFQGAQAAGPGQDGGVVEIDRAIPETMGSVVIDDVDQFAHRAGAKVGFEPDVDVQPPS